MNLLTPSPNFLYMSQSRENIVDQAISTSLELAEQKQHPGIQAIAFYYLGVLYILKKDLKTALRHF